MALISAAQKEFLQKNGYALLDTVVTRAHAEALRARALDIAETERRAGNPMLSAWSGMQQLRHMMNRGQEFEKIVQHRTVLEAVRVLLGDECLFTACTLNILHPKTPDHGLHVDYPLTHMAPPRPVSPLLVSCIWMLDDFFPHNGATSVIPASHLRVDELPHAGREYADEIVICGHKGSVIVLNSAVWHGSSANKSDAPRLALLTYYRRRDLEFDGLHERVEKASPEVLARATPVLRALLGK